MSKLRVAISPDVVSAGGAPIYDPAVLSLLAVIMACLKYMSEAEVRDMAEANGFVPEDEEEEIRSDYEANRTYERVALMTVTGFLGDQ